MPNRFPMMYGEPVWTPPDGATNVTDSPRATKFSIRSLSFPGSSPAYKRPTPNAPGYCLLRSSVLVCAAPVDDLRRRVVSALDLQAIHVEAGTRLHHRTVLTGQETQLDDIDLIDGREHVPRDRACDFESRLSDDGQPSSERVLVRRLRRRDLRRI